jgi:hypothetical protein
MELSMLTAYVAALLVYPAAPIPREAPQGGAHPPQIQADTGVVSESAFLPVEGDALRALLRDVFVARPRPSDGVITSPSGEVFRYNGAYQRIDGRRRQEGAYTIEGNAVCTHGAGFVRQCRRVLAAPGGRYAFVDTADGSSAPMIISPLE